MVWLTAPASAQSPLDVTTSRDSARRNLDDSFRQVLRNPGDMGANRGYADALVDAGEYEKAIATLERVLITDPSQTAVRVEIGALYFRLGSYETARAYFRRALEESSLPADLRARVEQYLADINERLSAHQFTGFATTGARWNENANTGPNSTLLRSSGINVPRPTSTSPQSDYSFFGAGRVQHSYDLDTQNEAKIVTTGLGYGNAFTRFSHQDLLLGEITTGVRFKPAPLDASNFQIRPHVIGNYVSLDGDRYADTIGFGVDMQQAWTDNLVSELIFEFRHAAYGNIPRLGDTFNQTGDEKVVKLRTAYEFNPAHLLVGDFVFRSAASKRAYYDVDQYGIVVTYSYTFAAPAQLTEQSWNLSPYVSWYNRGYGGPDPTVDPRTTRNDDEVRLGLIHNIPFADGWLLYQQVEHTWGNSNIPNYDYQDTAVVVGVTRRF